MDEISLAELTRNFTDLKAYFREEFTSLKDQMVVREVYKAEQDHLKDRVKSLENSRKALVGTVTALSVGLLGEILRAVVFAPKH